MFVVFFKFSLLLNKAFSFSLKETIKIIISKIIINICAKIEKFPKIETRKAKKNYHKDDLRKT